MSDPQFYSDVFRFQGRRCTCPSVCTRPSARPLRSISRIMAIIDLVCIIPIISFVFLREKRWAKMCKIQTFLWQRDESSSEIKLSRQWFYLTSSRSSYPPLSSKTWFYSEFGLISPWLHATVFTLLPSLSVFSFFFIQLSSTVRHYLLSVSPSFFPRASSPFSQLFESR